MTSVNDLSLKSTKPEEYIMDAETQKIFDIMLKHSLKFDNVKELYLLKNPGDPSNLRL